MSQYNGRNTYVFKFAGRLPPLLRYSRNSCSQATSSSRNSEEGRKGRNWAETAARKRWRTLSFSAGGETNSISSDSEMKNNVKELLWQVYKKEQGLLRLIKKERFLQVLILCRIRIPLPREISPLLYPCTFISQRLQ